MKSLLTLIALLVTGTLAVGQNDTLRYRVDTSIAYLKYDRDMRVKEGSVVIYQGEQIAALMDTLKTAEIPLPGYRIQVSFGRKEEVNSIRTDFLHAYPEIGAYISWLQPNFRLRVGDFRTRLDAERFRKNILDDFPGSYIVRDHIDPLNTGSRDQGNED